MMFISLKEKIQDTFDYLHANPEISWEETNTTTYIQNTLTKNRLSCTNIRRLYRGNRGLWEL